MTKRERQLAKEIFIGLAWRMPIFIFALLGAIDWLVLVMMG